MKRSLPFILSLVCLAFVCADVRATDYALDTTFNPDFGFETTISKLINEVAVQPDGKILVGGAFSTVGGAPSKFIARLDPDGTREETFNSPFSHTSGMISYVTTIRYLPDGKIWVTGQFKVGPYYSSYARLNPDGSFDPTLTDFAMVSERIEPLPNGQYLACGGRLVDGEPYYLAHRLNADGKVDPSFRVTLGDGVCKDIALLPDGKLLVAGSFYVDPGTYIDPIQRLNADGSKDTSFDLAPASVSFVDRIAVLPDGKIVAPFGAAGTPGRLSQILRFNSDGSVEKDITNCGANGTPFDGMLAQSDGSVLITGCRKWPTASVYQFARILSDGSMEQSLDRMDFNGPVVDIRSGSNGDYYAIGRFTTVAGLPRMQLARLRPYRAPIKPKFDFDGDGRSDISVFRPSDGFWYMNQSSAGIGFINWGLGTDQLAAGDYNADGKTDVGVYRDGVWYYLPAGVYNYQSLGGPLARPMIGDFDGDKRQDTAAHSSNGEWLIRLGTQAFYDHSAVVVNGQAETDTPVIGDLDGDSREEVGYFRDGDWFYRDHANGAPLNSFHWGAAGDIPVPGDYDGDGTTDFAVFRPSTGVWWINRSTEGHFVIHFGANGDVPVPADYDGDERTDIAVFRNGEWWQLLSNGSVIRLELWGLAGDIPIPAQAQ